MLLLRFKDVKLAVAKSTNLGSNDTPRLMDYVNRATERLLYDGKWKGTTQTYRFCVDANGCIVWPREIETIEAIAVCSQPLKIRNEWYEFSDNGVGVIRSDSNLCSTLIDRGEVCAFDEVTGEDKKLAVFCDKQEADDTFITLQFYNESGQWVRTQFEGEDIDGEKLELASPGTYVYTTNTCKPGGLIHVSKDVTRGVVRLYSYDTGTGALKPLGYYQPDEEVPVYRRSLIPSLSNGSCDQQQVTVVAKLRFIPVTTDDSFLLISHREAIRLACKAVKLEEDENWNDAVTNWNMAHQCLSSQLSHHKGSGERFTLNVESPAIWGGGIQNVV